jgi:DNA-binding beta-propeller fold protein YncE
MDRKEDRMVKLHVRGGGRRLSLLVAPVAALLAFAASAQAAPFVYVTSFGQGGNFILQFGVGPGGRLAPLASTFPGGFPAELAVSPDAKSLYVSDPLGGFIRQYDIESDGTISEKNAATPTDPRFPAALAVSPDGRSVYVANSNGNSVSQFDVGAEGQLTPKTPETVGAQSSPFGVAVSPDGASVYAVNTGSDSVSQYTVGTGGRLAPKAPATVATGTHPQWVAISPNGKSVYVTSVGSGDPGSGRVSQYDVAPNGALTPKSPARVAASNGTEQVAVSPNGKSVYVTLPDSGVVLQYDAAANGTLTPKSPAAVDTVGLAQGVGVSPDGSSVYVAGLGTGTPGSGDIAQYDVGANGALTPKSPPTVHAAGAFALAVTPLPKAQPKPGWEGFVTNPATGCRARVQVPYLEGGRRVTAYTEVFCPRKTELTIRSRLRSDYSSADATVDQKGCISGCRFNVGTAHRFFRLSCPESAQRRPHQRYYSDIVFYPGANSGAATTERSRGILLSPFCAQ